MRRQALAAAAAAALALALLPPLAPARAARQAAARPPGGALAGRRNGVCWTPQRYSRPPRPRYCVLEADGAPSRPASRFVEALDAAWGAGALHDFLLVTRRRYSGPVPFVQGANASAGEVAAYRALFLHHPVTEAAQWLCVGNDTAGKAEAFENLRVVWYDGVAKQYYAERGGVARFRQMDVALPSPVALRARPPRGGGRLESFAHAAWAITRRATAEGALSKEFSCLRPLLDALAANHAHWPSKRRAVDLVLGCHDKPWVGDTGFVHGARTSLQAVLSTGLVRRVWTGGKDTDRDRAFETLPQGLSWHYVWGRERQLYEAIRSASLGVKRGALGAWGAREGHTAASKDAAALDAFLSSGSAAVERRMVPPLEYYAELAKYRFLVAPRGKAILSPKFAEALLVMTIPITLGKYAAFQDVRDYGWPIVLVDNWHDITQDAMDKWWDELSPRLEAARWTATREGFESLLWGECYGQGEAAAEEPLDGVNWARPCADAGASG